MATQAKSRHAAWRTRQREAGLVPMEVWIHPDNRERLKKAAARLEKIGPPASRRIA